MPKMVKIFPNKAFDAKSAAEKAMLAAAIKTGPIEMPYATAMENVRLSGGMYFLAAPKPEIEAEPVDPVEKTPEPQA